MKAKVKVALITGCFSIVTCVVGGILGRQYGSQEVWNEIGNTMTYVQGDNNQVIINDVDDFMNNYQKLNTQKEQLLDENMEYHQRIKEDEQTIEQLQKQYDDLMNNNNDEISNLNKAIDEFPLLEYKNMGLMINGNDINVQQEKNVAFIDGRIYFSKEIAENLLAENQSITMDNNVIYIGRVIAEKANLFDKWVVEKSGCNLEWSGKDSYGNNYSNAMDFEAYEGEVTYNLSEEYSMLRLKVAASERANTEDMILTIKADNNVVRTIELNKYTKPIYEEEIPINNCNLLTIKFNSPVYNYCIISDAFVYN